MRFREFARLRGGCSGYVGTVVRELDKPLWHGQRPWFEIWFAVVLDEDRKRALWLRQTLFVPQEGAARATVWGAWFDANHEPPSRAAKTYASVDLDGYLAR